MNETRIDQEIVNRLKLYKDEDRKSLFASYYIGCLQSLLVRFSFGGVIVLKTPLELRKKFIDNMNTTIQENNFDYLDNITLDFMGSLHFVTNFGNIAITIDEEQKKKFIEICNSFKGKKWEEVCPIFIDNTYDLLCKCSIQGGQLILGARMWH
jgi:hypothetical protein